MIQDGGQLNVLKQNISTFKQDMKRAAKRFINYF
jgi:hypothetical protein